MDSKVKIIRDSGLTEIEYIDARYPYFRLRGKSITPEQAFEVIRRTDFTIWEVLSSKGLWPKEYISGINTLVGTYLFNLYNESGKYKPECWCRPNGIIGINGITERVPMESAALCDLDELAFNFPYLDFVITITDWNEQPPYAEALITGELNKLRVYSEPSECTRRYLEIITDRDRILAELPCWVRKLESYYDIGWYIDYPDFLDHIQIGYWVHNGEIEILNTERAKLLYTEYDSKYSDANKYIYSPRYYCDRKVMPANYDYFKRCLASYGLDPERVLSSEGYSPIANFDHCF